MCQITEDCVSDLCYVIYATPKNHYKCVSACNTQRLEATRGIECTDRTRINAPTVLLWCPLCWSCKQVLARCVVSVCVMHNFKQHFSERYKSKQLPPFSSYSSTLFTWFFSFHFFISFCHSRHRHITAMQSVCACFIQLLDSHCIT